MSDILPPIPEQCPGCVSKKLSLIIYAYDDPEHYDGVSEIKCEACKKRFGRWTKKELAPGEVEKRYGREDKQKCP